MKLSDRGLMAIAHHEGIVLSRYRDSVGVWTIGIGHTKAAGPPDPETFAGRMSLADALTLLRKDIEKYEAAVRKAVGITLAQHEFDALVSFHYNTGAIARAQLTRTLNQGDRKAAGRQFMNWIKPPEIRKRREAERDLFIEARYPPPVAMLWPADGNGRIDWKRGERINLTEVLGPQAAPAAAPPARPVQPSIALPSPAGPAPGGFLAWLKSLFTGR